jgi:serine/threonine-protein kinase
MQTRLAQFHFLSEPYKAGNQAVLALFQRLAGDSVGAIATAEQACTTFEQLYRDQPDNATIAQTLSLCYAVMGNKDSALKAAERAIMLVPTAKDPVDGPAYEESLAFVQTMFGENSRAISTLARLLETPYSSFPVGTTTPVTSALLRLDPSWDPLRSDPAFQKLCEEKQH